MRDVYIYALCEPDTEDVRYIGKTVRFPTRIRAHYREKRTTRKCRWLNSLDGRLPIVKVLEIVGEESWEEAEKRQIRIHREMGCDLTNHTDGGDGRSAFTVEEIETISQQMKAKMNDPDFKRKIFTPERAAKISAALTGKNHSKDHLAKLPQNQKGFKQSAGAIDKKRIAATGKKQTEEWKAMISANNKGNKWSVGNTNMLGKKQSPEARAKIADFQKGKPKTVEQREKMSIARKKWWADRRKGE